MVIACGVTPQPVPFSRLTFTAQLEVLCHRAEDSWNLCAPLNPFLQTWKTRAAAGRLQATPWPRGASKRLGGPAYAERFAELLNNIPLRAAKPGASLAAQEEFIRERLDAAHLFPLLWATET